ncbi:MAG: M1 family aminopeptidase [bacterium]
MPDATARVAAWLCVAAALLLAAGEAQAGNVAGHDADAAAGPEIRHSLAVSLFPSDMSLRATDTIYVTGDDFPNGRIEFLLNRALSVERVESPIGIGRWYTQADLDPAVFKAEPDSEAAELVGRAIGIFIELADRAPEGLHFPIVITYSGVIHDSLEAPAKAYAKGFETTTGLVGDRGAYLTNESLWYPFRFGQMFSFSLRVDLPADWMSVSQGALAWESGGATEPSGLAEPDGASSAEPRRAEIWIEDNPTPELYLVAGPYARRQEEYVRPDGAGTVAVMTYTYGRQDSLSQIYIDATKRYLAMYEGLVGPYPYPKFALVENYWQTGFGMPSFTLLGSKVIRLPFIVHTSYGHEILHNWWGNSVYVDYADGNWCEGLTTYGADYLYKQAAGDAEARAYRHQTLVGFHNYVTDNKDFPLAEFSERSDAATQSVGYGKSLMVYHMLHQSLGDSLFWECLREFYARYKFKTARWSDMEAVFTERAGRDLGWFFDQWLERPGAPTVSLADASVSRRDSGWPVAFTVRQNPPAYVLDLPIVVETDRGSETFTVRLSGDDSTYAVEPKGRPLALAVDPDFDIFRHLYTEEIPITLGSLFGQDSVLALAGAAEAEDVRSAMQEAAATWGLGRSFVDEGTDSAPGPSGAVSGHVWLMGRGKTLDGMLAGARGQIEIAGDTVTLGGAVTLAGATHQLAGKTLVCAIRNPGDPGLAVGIVVSQDVASLRAIAPRLPHYSSYSYLLFEKDKPVVKGVWEIGASPLRADLQER